MNRRQRQFLAAIVAVAVLLWLATYGAYSGPKEFLYDVSITDVLLAAFTLALAYFTYLLYEVTRELRKVAHRQDRHYTLTERAYLELSHEHPGLKWSDDGRPGFQLKMTNKGSTPCRLVDFKMGFALWYRKGSFDLLPAPVYDKTSEFNPARGFLLPGGYIYVSCWKVKDNTDFQVQIGKGATLLAYCYVEYSDIFGNLHHAGWGREYEPVNEGKQNNLGYLSSEDYNYDRPADRQVPAVVPTVKTGLR